MHKLLIQQIESSLGNIQEMPSELFGFFDKIDDTYKQRDKRIVALEKVLKLSCEEFDEKSDEFFYKLKTLAEGSPIGILVTDRNLKIEFANKNISELLEISKDKLINRSLAEFINSDAFNEISCIDDLPVSGITCSGIIKQSDGCSLEVELTLIKYISKNENTLCVYIKNDTQLSYVERKIKLFERNLRAVFDNIQVGIMLIDAETFEIIDINKEAITMLGFKKENVIGKTYRLFMYSSDIESERTVSDSNLSAEKFESILVTKNGCLPIIKTISTVTIESKECMLEAFIDNSKQKELRENLERVKRETERVSKAKSEFLANMSHEMRTPLNPIIGMTELLLQSENISGEERDMLQTIGNAATSLLGIINNILDISKIEAGMIVIEEIMFSLNDLIREVFDVMKITARKKSLIMELELDSQCDNIFLGDAFKLKQIIMNLVGNAIKFTNEGMVKIKSKVLEDSGEFKKIYINVEDTGIGISKDAISKLFKPFTQVDGSITRRFGGTGLGLSISYRLVKLMGGELEISSVEGAGTTFGLTLPFKKVDDVLLEELLLTSKTNHNNKIHKLPKENNMATKNILVVEDNEANQKLIKLMLKKRKYSVEIAVNGFEAVNAIKEKGELYSMVFMDCHMPVMDGFMATQEIRRMLKAQEKHLPVIALTASIFEQDRKACFDSGMDDVLAKPIEKDKLDYILEKWI